MPLYGPALFTHCKLRLCASARYAQCGNVSATSGGEEVFPVLGHHRHVALCVLLFAGGSCLIYTHFRIGPSQGVFIFPYTRPTKSLVLPHSTQRFMIKQNQTIKVVYKLISCALYGTIMCCFCLVQEQAVEQRKSKKIQ